MRRSRDPLQIYNSLYSNAEIKEDIPLTPPPPSDEHKNPFDPISGKNDLRIKHVPSSIHKTT